MTRKYIIELIGVINNSKEKFLALLTSNKLIKVNLFIYF